MKLILSDYHQCSNCDGTNNLYDIMNETDGSCITVMCVDCLQEICAHIEEPSIPESQCCAETTYYVDCPNDDCQELIECETDPTGSILTCPKCKQRTRVM